jgi:hypothetical protein
VQTASWSFKPYLQARGETPTDESAGTVALASRPSEGVKLLNQGCHFGRIEKRCDLLNSRATRYLARCDASCLSYDHAPGSSRFAGALFFGFAGLILVLASDSRRGLS